MLKKMHASRIGLALFVVVCCAESAFAQPPCPIGTVLAAACAVGPMPGGYVTIAPGAGTGDTFASDGLVITVCITCSGVPLVGLPAAAITVAAPGVVFCPGGSNIADTPTDAAGCATFTGALCGGGCAPMLDIFSAGTYLCTVPVGINSPDNGMASPLFVDAGDLGAFAAVLGNPATYTPCFDFNESGPPTIDASDLAFFASMLGNACGAVCP
jgi:hypothetical protein